MSAQWNSPGEGPGREEAGSPTRRRFLLLLGPCLGIPILVITFLYVRGRHKPEPAVPSGPPPAGQNAKAPTNTTGPSTSFRPTFLATTDASIEVGEIEPADGAAVRGGDVWVRWHGPPAATGRVSFGPTGGGGEPQQVSATDAAGPGDPLLAHLTGLKPGEYQYTVEHTAGGWTQRSRTRRLTVKAGPTIAFAPPTVEATVRRDYDQRITFALKNDTPEKLTVAARAAALFPDLPADVIGPGSADEPVDVAPGASVNLTMSVTAPDARRAAYDIPVEAAGAFGLVRVRIDNPRLRVSLKVISEDPRTLAKTVEIRNDGDRALTDLSLAVASPNDADASLEPAVDHANLYAGSAMRVVVSPVLYLEFKSLRAELECRAAGQSSRFPLEFGAPAGKRLIGFRHASIQTNSSTAWYCTNKPNICTPVPAGQGTGPAGDSGGGGQTLLASASGGFGFNHKKQAACQCDLDEACKDIDALLTLIDNATRSVTNYESFVAKFDELFKDLAQKQLACRYDAGSNVPPETDPLLVDISKRRHGLHVKPGPFPTPDPSSIQNVGARVTTPEGQDYAAVEEIARELVQLAASLGCPGPDDGGDDPIKLKCPELGDSKKVKKRLDNVGKVTSMLAQDVDNPRVKDALSRLNTFIGLITKNLGRLIKLQENCNLLKDLLTAIDEVNDATTGPELAKGFDDLFRVVGGIGEKLLPGADPYFKLLAQDKSFFQDVSSAVSRDADRANKILNQ